MSTVARREVALVWLITALVSLPAMLFAFLGLSSRLMGDDFGLFAASLHLGGWHNFLYWWNGWYSSYTFILFNDLLAPLGPEYIAQAFPAINIALWWSGISWLYAIALRRLRLKRNRWPISVALAALTIAATFTSFQTWESIFWYAASVRYVLPIGILMLFLAAAIAIADRPHPKWLTSTVSLLGALLCFVNAGYSELHSALQLLSLSLALPLVFAAFDRSRIRTDLFLLAAGWLGSAAGLLLQLLTPGWSARVDKLLQTDPADPMRSLPQFFAETVSTTLDFFCYRAGIPSFLLMMTAGMAVALLASRRSPSSKAAASVSLSARPILLGLAVQLCFVPVLWGDEDAAISVIGLFDGAAINALLIGVHVFLLWRRRQLESSLARHQHGTMRYIIVNLGAALALMAMTQAADMPAKLAVYLFVSALLLLGNLTWQLHCIEADPRSRYFVWAAAASVAFALFAWALPVAVGHLSLGFVFKRTLAYSTLTQMLSALIWGGCLGYLIGRSCSLTPARSAWTARFITLCFLLVASITIGMLAMQARLIPDFQTYAQDWDARHRRIVQLRENGESVIEVAPLRFDLSEFVSAEGRTFENVSPYFYQVDSIVAA